MISKQLSSGIGAFVLNLRREYRVCLIDSYSSRRSVENNRVISCKSAWKLGRQLLPSAWSESRKYSLFQQVL
jgi:hypothetical protein